MHRRPILIFAGMLATAGVSADSAYKWVDAEGVVHYSDVPVEGAESVELSGYSRKTGAQLARTRSPAADTGADEGSTDQPFRYESLAVASPAAEETLWNIEGILNVSLALSPGLQSGHQVRVYFDGTPRTVTGTTFQIEEVWRGVHNIQVEVIDEAGELMIRSQPNRFYVQQNTVIR